MLVDLARQEIFAIVSLILLRFRGTGDESIEYVNVLQPTLEPTFSQRLQQHTATPLCAGSGVFTPFFLGSSVSSDGPAMNIVL
jgi:hypothetical protein